MGHIWVAGSTILKSHLWQAERKLCPLKTVPPRRIVSMTWRDFLGDWLEKRLSDTTLESHLWQVRRKLCPLKTFPPRRFVAMT